MKSYKIVTILLLIIISSSCENGSNNESEINYLKGTKWILLGFQSHETHVVEFKPEDLKEMDIEFNGDNWIHAISSCNIFDGYYSVAASGLLLIDSLYTTLINCENNTVRDWEERYYNELINALNYQIAGSRLIINTKLNNDIIFKSD
jgi:heat shock protein HslJ